MIISKINAYSPSFRAVKSSAARRAIENANGDTYKLFKIRKCVESQKGNFMYHVYADESAADSKDYVVYKSSGEDKGFLGAKFDKLEDACLYAESLKDIKIIKALYNEKNPDTAAEKQKLISQIMLSCHE